MFIFFNCFQLILCNFEIRILSLLQDNQFPKSKLLLCFTIDSYKRLYVYFKTFHLDNFITSLNRTYNISYKLSEKI